MCPTCEGSGEITTDIHLLKLELELYKEVLSLVANADNVVANVMDLIEERNKLRKASDDHCGVCFVSIEDPKNAVRIRSIGAPNPFCSMECAQQWSP